MKSEGEAAISRNEVTVHPSETRFDARAGSTPALPRIVSSESSMIGSQNAKMAGESKTQ